MKEGNAFIMCFSIADQESLKEVEKFYAEGQRAKNSDFIPSVREWGMRKQLIKVQILSLRSLL